MARGMQPVIDFEWTKCRVGYRRIVGRDGRPKDGIETASLHVDRFRPLEISPTLYAIFADNESSVEGAIDFCNRFGLLTIRQTEGGGISTSLRDFFRQQAEIKRAVALYERGDLAALAKRINYASRGERLPPMTLFAPRVDLNAEGRLKLSWVPQHLLSAMWLQLALDAAGGCTLVRCEHCQKPFVFGVGTRRRSTAMYCSRACNMAAFKARQAKR
jgi:hypothetical protein